MRGILTGLHVIEIAIPVPLQIKIKRMEKCGDIRISAKTLVKIRFAVIIEIMQACKAILTGDIHFASNHLQAKGLVHAGGKALPLEVCQ